MSTDTCVHCGKKQIHAGQGWSCLTCTECHTITMEDCNWNTKRAQAFNRGEINLQELQDGFRNRIYKMYYSPPETATGGEGQNSIMDF